MEIIVVMIFGVGVMAFRTDLRCLFLSPRFLCRPTTEESRTRQFYATIVATGTI
jgi:hypothetical protein